MNKFDIIFARIVKIVGLVLGSGIFVYETGWEHADRPYLYAAATMMMGLQIAETVDKIFGVIGKLKATTHPTTVTTPQTTTPPAKKEQQ